MKQPEPVTPDPMSPDPITDDELILYYYGESERAEEVAAALETSADLAERYGELEAVLDAIEPPAAPTRSDLYGHEVWRRVYPRLAAPRRSWLPRAAGWAVAATLLIAASFLLGRLTAPGAADPTALTEQARNRIFLVAVAEHLERSRFLLLELANSEAGRIDAAGIATARELRAESRLFRHAARESGESDVAHVLEELELFLTELAHTQPEAAEDLGALLARLEDKNLLFKVRVLGSSIEERAKPPTGRTTT